MTNHASLVNAVAVNALPDINACVSARMQVHKCTRCRTYTGVHGIVHTQAVLSSLPAVVNASSCRSSQNTIHAARHASIDFIVASDRCGRTCQSHHRPPVNQTARGNGIYADYNTGWGYVRSHATPSID